MTDRAPPSEEPLAQVLSLQERRLLNQGLLVLEKVVQQTAARLAGNINLDDLRSIGHEALLRLIRRYQPDKSPLGPYLRRRLMYALLDGIRVESHSRVMVARARAYRASLRVAEARERERSELKAASVLTGTNELPTEADYRAQLNLILREQAAAMGVSLIASSEGETAKADSSTNPEKVALRAAAVHELHAAVASLDDERQRTVIEQYYFHDESFVAIAAKLSLSKSWVSRIHARAVRTLAKLLGGD